MSTPASAPDAAATAMLLARCHDCDLLQQVAPLPAGGRTICGRCGATLFASRPDGFQRAFALYLTALVLLILANAFPFLTLQVQGRVQTSHLLSGVVSLYRDGMWPVAAAVVLFVLAVPLAKILIGLLVVGPLAFGRRLPGASAAYRLFDRLHPWAMTEIFLLGVLVSYTKLVGLATVVVGPSLVAYVGLILVLIAADTACDPHDVWERLGRSPRAPGLPGIDQRTLVGCHVCGLVCRVPEEEQADARACPRCAAPLHYRKPDSWNRTAALLATAAMLYVPANLYPVMTFAALGQGEPSTILGGVKELIVANMWPLALIVFVASVMVPLLKLVSMTYLLVSVRRRSTWRLRDRTVIYRLNELVGRWSMVDVFVITILVALVQLGSVASIVPGIGIAAFGCVVVLTMLAALTFDPRLMWDAAGRNDER